MEKRGLPSLDFLRKKLKLGVSIEEDAKGRKEAILESKGYPAVFQYKDPTLRKHLGYRAVRWLIGGWVMLGNTPKKEKGYGWAVITGGIITLGIILASAYGDLGAISIASYIVGAIAGVILGRVLYSTEDVDFIEFQKQGIRYPVAYHYDEQGTKVVDYRTADRTTLSSYRVPIEALKRVVAFMVREFVSSTGKPSYLSVSHFGNFVWGDSTYAEFSPFEIMFLGPPVTLLPESMQEAIDDVTEDLKKHKINEEDAERVRSLLKETYIMNEKVKENAAEIVRISGRKYIKIKVTKYNYAFMMQWPKLLEEIRIRNKAIVEKQQNDAEYGVDILNKAITVATEHADIEARIQEAVDRGMKIKMNQYISALHKTPEDAEMIAKARMSQYAREANQTEESLMEMRIRKFQNPDLEEDEDGKA